jgi:hypothetical protein
MNARSTSPSYLLFLVGVLVATSACSQRARPEGPPRSDYNTLTAEELAQRQFYSVLEAVQTLRPNWLSLHGVVASDVQVYVDDNHVGGLDVLRTIRIPSVVRIRHIDGVQAPARYGAGHESGVILVSTRAASR